MRASGLPHWFDLLAAALGISVLAPLLVLLWLLVKLGSPGPALFVQERVGKCGRRFRCLKFRTMYDGAPPGNWMIEDFGNYLFNSDGLRDPRLTPTGRALRKLSVDELPQLLNVIRGDMALAGPRPEIPEIVDQYPPAYHRRHTVLPGISGQAQVHGRSDLSYAQTMAYDLDYVSNRSQRRDLVILWRTLSIVLRAGGAR